MSIMTVTTRVTHKYLMYKSKYELASMLLDLMKDEENLLIDLKTLLEEGIDDDWQSRNFPLVNKLRSLVGLEEYSPELMERIKEYWRNL